MSDYASARVRVRSGEWVSGWLSWFGMAASQVRHWRPPSVNEQAMIASLSDQPEQGMVIPGVYSTQHQQANDNRPETPTSTLEFVDIRAIVPVFVGVHFAYPNLCGLHHRVSGQYDSLNR